MTAKMKIEYEHVKAYLKNQIKRKAVNWCWFRAVMLDSKLRAKLNSELKEEQDDNEILGKIGVSND